MGRIVAARATALPAGPGLCRHCGLATSGQAEYCCYGCELAAEIAAQAASHHQALNALLTFSLLLAMSVMMLSLFLFAEDVYGAGGPSRQMASLRQFYRVASAVLATPVVVLCGLPLVRRIAVSVRERRLGMEFLITSGALAAYGLSLGNLLTGRPGIYFDSATAALVLSTLGRYLEASARTRAAGLLGPSLRLASAPVLAARGDAELEPTSPAQIEPGMRLRIRMDETLPVDAALQGKAVEVNLAVLSGESRPRLIDPGALVPAGAIPLSSDMECIALRCARDSTLEQLAALARTLRARPAAISRLADRLATALVPVVWLLAAAALFYWTTHVSLERGVVVALSVVLVACPCTYGVATPLVLWLALRNALARGVLIRSAEALEQLAAVRLVAFDKTGTLTQGRLGLRMLSLLCEMSEGEVLGLVAGLEDGNRHPVARALLAAAADRGILPQPILERTFVVGRGVAGRDGAGRSLLLGSPTFLAEAGIALPPAVGDNAAIETAHALLAVDGAVVALFALQEALRPEAAATIATLKADGLDAQILTGDVAEHATPVAASLRIPCTACLSAADKAHRVQSFGAQVAMVGDGQNDAPALAGVGPSFALSDGSALARGLAQVTLLAEDLRLVPWTLRLGRETLRVARRNLWASTLYNVVFVALATAGLLRPVWAGVSMLSSSLLMLMLSLGVGEPEDPTAQARDREMSEAMEPTT